MKKRNIALVITTSLLLTACNTIDEVSQKVMDDIDSIGTVELEDEKLIIKIEEVYSTLTDKQKEQVKNYATLLDARDKLDIALEEQRQTEEAERKKTRRSRT